MVRKHSMLKASIIYYPGSGGSFLYRILTLSEKTIMGTGGANKLEYITETTKLQRLERYINWGGYNTEWKNNESRAKLSYKIGDSEFIKYELSPLWLIDKLHPSEFVLYESQKLWDPSNTFENFVFIDIDSDDVEFLLKNQQSKLYNLNFNQEQLLYAELERRFEKNKYNIKFKSFFDETLFLQEIKNIDTWLNLKLDFELVKILWNKWFLESSIVWKI